MMTTLTRGCLRLTEERGSSNSSKCRATSSRPIRRTSAMVHPPWVVAKGAPWRMIDKGSQKGNMTQVAQSSHSYALALILRRPRALGSAWRSAGLAKLTSRSRRSSTTGPSAPVLRSIYPELAVLLKKNVVVSGGTGTGKTSLLNALSGCISRAERVIVVEDTSELQFDHEHTVRLEACPPDDHDEGGMTIRDLFVTSLRMRPDRIVVSEARREEAWI